jgi:NAD(P)-dependent dehydrogenase (short-subunit alcohol dehydrogenase family)
LVFGGIETKNMNNFFKKNYIKKTISNRMARVGEYNEIINFFCSDKANYVNGSCIIVDGGATSIL